MGAGAGPTEGLSFTGGATPPEQAHAHSRASHKARFSQAQRHTAAQEVKAVIIKTALLWAKSTGRIEAAVWLNFG